MTPQKKLNPFILVILVILFSCGGDDPKPVKSSAKAITSFKFSSFTPEVTGTITEADKKIALTVPAGTNVTALSPTIAISEKATVSPASGVAQNFSNPVTYTVTAEDGTTQAYQVTVTVPIPLSTAKAMTSFKFSGLTPEVTGTIDEDSHHVSVTVPNGTDVTALVPTILISEKATISPASGIAKDYTSPVVYTITAEDASFQEYLVTVIIDETVNFTLDAYTGSLEIEQDGVLLIQGDNFGNFENNKVVFVSNLDSNVTFEKPAIAPSDNETLFIAIDEDMPLGEYKVKVFIGAQSKFMDEVFTVVVHAPEIASLDQTTVTRGENLVITGNYFAAFENKVFLTLGSETPVELDIVSESKTTIEVTVPDDLDPGDYTLSVTSNDKTVFYNTEMVTVQVPADVPFISEVTDTSISRGETMVIKGLNLKKIGVATNINFLPWPNGGTTIIRSLTVNADGTEATYLIPNDFPTGTYTIVIEVDFEFSEEFDEVIQINP
jgi:hypothetical protein